MTVETLGRAIRLYRQTASSRSAIVLLLANVIPLVGVLFFGWSLQTILVLYWIENGIVGLFNVPKIILAKGSFLPRLQDLPLSAALAATGSATLAAKLQEQWRQAQAAQAAPAAPAVAASAPTDPPADAPVAATEPGPAAPGIAGSARRGGTTSPSQALRPLGARLAERFAIVPRAGLAIFFAFHYGMFWLVHGIFVFMLPAFAGADATDPVCLDSRGFPIECFSSAFGELDWVSVALGAVALFLSHGASFLLNYIGRGEHLTASPSGQMSGVYGRVVVLHLTIIFGSMVVAFLGSPVGALLVLVVLKTAFDVKLHLRERRAADSRIPADTTFGRLVR